jgi:hypothetical protein
MAYDQNLARRIREELGGTAGLEEKEMFGGVGYLIRGNMACGVHKEALIVRVGLERYQEALNQRHTRPFDITGRSLKGWVMVMADGYRNDDDLKAWIKQGVDFSNTLPPKERK